MTGESTPAEAPAVPSDARDILAEIREICGELGCINERGVPLRFVQDLRSRLSKAAAREEELIRAWDPASPTERQELDRFRRGWGPSSPTERQKRRSDVLACMHAVCDCMSELCLPDDHEIDEQAQGCINAAYTVVDKQYGNILSILNQIDCDPAEWPDIKAAEERGAQAASPPAPSEEFAGLVRGLVAPINRSQEFWSARSALLAHGARLEGEMKRLSADLEDLKFRWREAACSKFSALEEIGRLRGEEAQRDAALAQAATAGPVIVSEEVRALSEAATPGPWGWMIHDPSMASLTGPDDMRDHVFSISPCENCQKRAKDWEWGRCKTPNEADADLIAKGINWIRSLLAQQTSGDAP